MTLWTRLALLTIAGSHSTISAQQSAHVVAFKRGTIRFTQGVAEREWRLVATSYLDVGTEAQRDTALILLYVPSDDQGSSFTITDMRGPSAASVDRGQRPPPLETLTLDVLHAHEDIPEANYYWMSKVSGPPHCTVQFRRLTLGGVEGSGTCLPDDFGTGRASVSKFTFTALP
jgi:hypothetical protein